MSLPVCLKRAFSSRSNQQDEEGQELGDLNESGLSLRSIRIMNDIAIGNYPCAVCMDPISFGRGPEYSLWHCTECHNIYHFRCVRVWCESNRGWSVASGPHGFWKCPSCTTEQPNITNATCWCGKTAHENIEPGKSNSCDDICGKLGQCSHGEDKVCQQACHPGPCKLLCFAQCLQAPVSPARDPATWERFCTRVRQYNKQRAWPMIRAWGLTAVIYGGLGALLHFHIRWHTMPYKYPYFDDVGETLGLTMGGVFLYIVPSIVYFSILFLVTYEFMVSTLNLNSIDTKPGRKALTKCFGAIFLALMFIGIWALPIIGFAAGPNIAWYNQMKDSCNGLNTRIWMDEMQGTRFTAENLIPDIPRRDFYIAGHIEPTTTTRKEPFQYYQRLSGSTSHYFAMAIDVDIANHQWRLMLLNNTDKANKWLAYDSKQLDSGNNFPTVPAFPKPAETLLAKGEFTPISATQRTMFIPEMDIALLDMWGFIQNYHLEPFLRVVNITDYTEVDYNNKKLRIVESGWTSKPHPREIMRTASFGHSRQDLMMCVRDPEHAIDQKNAEDVANGVIEDEVAVRSWGIQTYHLVPFAIISTYRQRIQETGLRSTKESIW